MAGAKPGLNSRRLVNLMRAAVARCELNLAGLTVLTEAASGAYIVTPILAALAGAGEVFAVTRTTRHGSAEEIAEATYALADAAGAPGRIRVVTRIEPEMLAAADMVTNSGHVRPIDAGKIAVMKPGAVIPLMYEAWEFRDGDVDLAACRGRGVSVVAVNERHPTVDVFSYLGPMAAKLLMDAGIAVYGNNVLLLCDNPFGPFIERGLTGIGASVKTCGRFTPDRERYDAVILSLTPRAAPVFGAAEAALLHECSPGAVVAQFFGDLDRAALAAVGLSFWPHEAPPPGHMGILPSEIGPEPIVRLQAGGLKSAEVALRGLPSEYRDLAHPVPDEALLGCPTTVYD